MPDSLPSIEFARALLALKQRTGRGYRDLASNVYVSNVYVSTAAPHRYCAGKALPAEFGFVRRLARLPGRARANSTASTVWQRVCELRVRSRRCSQAAYRLWLKAQLESGPARQ